MNCEQMTVLISAWLDGETTAQEEKQLLEHLEQCAQCRALLEQLQTLRASFTELEELQVPEGFADRVMERIEGEQKGKIVPLFRRPYVRALTGLAACAVLCIGLFSSGLGRGNSAESAPMAAAPAAMAESYDMELSRTQGYGVEAKTAAPATAEPAEAPAMT